MFGATDPEAGEAMRPRPTIREIMATSRNSPAGSSFQRQKPQAAPIADPYAIVTHAPPPPPKPVAVTRPIAPVPPAAPRGPVPAAARPGLTKQPPTAVARPGQRPVPGAPPAKPALTVSRATPPPSQMPATPGGVVKPMPPPVPVSAPVVAAPAAKPLKGFGAVDAAQARTWILLAAIGVGIYYVSKSKPHGRRRAA